MEMSIGTIGIGQGLTTALPGTTAQKTDGTVAGRNGQAVKKVAKEFESLFIGMMLKSMRETVGKDKLTDGGHGEEVYRSLLDQEYAKALSEHGGIGLAAMMERQLVKPAPDGGQSTNSHDETVSNAKIEVNHENR
jgi:peptidoglycan hydrolase FlgJ